MSFAFDRKSMNRIFELVDEWAERDREMLRERIPDDVIGSAAATDEEFAQMFAQKLEKDGVALLTFPDGVEVLASPLAVALELVDGGRELKRRFERITGEQ